MFIINFFSWVVFSLIKQSYKDFEFIHIKRDIFLWGEPEKIWIIVNLIITVTSNFKNKAYSSEINTLLMTRRHLINYQWIIFALFWASIKIIIYSICNERFLLFANEKSIKIIIFNVIMFNLTNVSPFVFNCQDKQRFRYSAFLYVGFIICAAYDKAKIVYDYNTVTIYASRALWTTYYSFVNDLNSN